MSESLKKLDQMRSKLIFLDALESEIKNCATIEEALHVIGDYRVLFKTGENVLRLQYRREIAQPEILIVST